MARFGQWVYSVKYEATIVGFWAACDSGRIDGLGGDTGTNREARSRGVSFLWLCALPWLVGGTEADERDGQIR